MSDAGHQKDRLGGVWLFHLFIREIHCALSVGTKNTNVTKCLSVLAEQLESRGEKRCSGCKSGQIIFTYKLLSNLDLYNKELLYYVFQNS